MRVEKTGQRVRKGNERMGERDRQREADRQTDAHIHMQTDIELEE